MASGVTTGCAWPGREESVTQLLPFMNFLVHSYTCCSDRYASPYWTFIRRWISMGFTPSLLKNRRQKALLLWCILQAGPPSLHYYCAIVLHSCTVLPPVSHSSNHQYHCCQRTDNRAVFRIVIALLRFSFESPSQYFTKSHRECSRIRILQEKRRRFRKLSTWKVWIKSDNVS